MTPPEYDPEPLRQLALSESGFVFDPRTGFSYALNATGLEVLKALRQGGTLAGIAESLRAHWDGAELAEEDLQVFLRQLADYGLGARAGEPA